MASASTPAAMARPAGRYAVYVAAVPLRAPQGPAQALMSSGYSLGVWDLQHFMVLLRPDPARTPTQGQVRPAGRNPSSLFDSARRSCVWLGWLAVAGAGVVGVRFPASRPGGCSRRLLRALAEQNIWGGSEEKAAEDPGQEELVRRARRRRRRRRRREVQRAVADRPGRREPRLPRLHQRAGGGLDRTKTCPGLAEISRPPMRRRNRGVVRTAFFYYLSVALVLFTESCSTYRLKIFVMYIVICMREWRHMVEIDRIG